MRAFIVRIVVICSFVMTFSIESKNAHKFSYTGKEKIRLINTIETKNCFVSYVKIKNNTFIIKQKKDVNKQLSVVRDALAAYIAECLDIAQRVNIVSFDIACPGKIKLAWPATLHTIVPGETVRKQQDSKYNTLRLRQFWATAKTFADKGLTRSIIGYMTWHKQLPIIVALDLLTGNSDRHCGNLCYDPKTDTFWAIDMDDTFNKDLCKFACQKLKHMIQKEGVTFTQDEILALQSMRNALQFLMRKHKPKDLILKLHAFAQQAGFVKGSPLYNVRIAKKLTYYETMIVQSYESASQLIKLIDKIVALKPIRSYSGESSEAIA